MNTPFELGAPSPRVIIRVIHCSRMEEPNPKFKSLIRLCIISFKGLGGTLFNPIGG